MKKLSSNQIKLIAIIAMVIDHVAYTFVEYWSIEGHILHIIGRITAPIMCFFIAEGYKYTKDLKKYALRLFIFALISQFPYVLFSGNNWTEWNIFFTLLIGLITIIIYDNVKNVYLKGLGILALLALSIICDWQYFVPLWCLTFHIFRGEENRIKRIVAFLSVVLLYFIAAGSIICAGSLIPLFILEMYNGKRGKVKGFKWVFYVFYPVHLVLIYYLDKIV